MPKQFDKAPYTKPALPEVITTVDVAMQGGGALSDGPSTYGSL